MVRKSSIAVLLALLCLSFSQIAYGQSADLGVIKSGPDSATANSDVAYDIQVFNAGPDTADTATLTDNIPAGMTFVSRSQTSGPPFVCTDPGAGFGGTVTCSTAGFPAGSSATFTFVFHIPGGTPDGTLFINTATITGRTPDDNPENGSSTVGTSVPIALADVAVTKTGPAAAAPGMNVTYTISVVNGASNAANNVTLQDVLPSPTTFVSLSPNVGCTTPDPGTNGTVTCNIGTLAAGAAIRYTLVVQLPLSVGSGTTVSNTATVAASNDPDSENDSSTTTLTVSSADLSVTKTGPASIISGTPLSYTITVTNNGPDDALNALLSDPLPAGTTFISLVQDSGPPASCSTPSPGTNGTVQCNWAPLNPTTAQFTLTVAVGNVSSVSNTASVSSDSIDSNPLNNSATATTAATQSADLAIVKTAPATVPAFGNLTYSLTVTNNGPSDAANVTISDSIPPNTTFVSFTAPAGWMTTTPPTGGTGTVTATNISLAASASAVFTLVVRVNSVAATTVTNTAVVTASTADPIGTNNTATATTAVTQSIPTLSPLLLALLAALLAAVALRLLTE